MPDRGMADTTQLVQLLMDFAPRGEPLDLPFLGSYGITEGEALKLRAAGWLRQLSENAYLLRGDSPTLEGAISFFVRRIPGLHVSGKAALDMRGIRYTLYARPRIDLWGDASFEFPSWAKELLLLAYQHESLFDASLPRGFAISALPGRSQRMPVAQTERAILEYLAGSLQSEMLREDNVNLVGMLRNIRLDVLQKLVDHCPRRDVVWGLKFIGEDEDFEWAKRLEC
jgi:Transcriptional regulator, AbiEi antitoxin N-terminal domain/Transcriptional regulator, AbiEi antitoxin, Type IV TA system